METVKQLNTDKSYFIKDTIKELSKRGKDFQGRIDVYNTIREVMNALNEYSAYVSMFMLLSVDQEQTRAKARRPRLHLLQGINGI
ncbi:hypothetical protein [Ligilactobacillus salivarius]|uniref:hypothetical protein n=1 Tax=Ligilactobacillus salivarius TaxID=1624 RepID=UPI001179C59A|nr:hypothetical protein [Ligilactobacillus salivarius]